MTTTPTPGQKTPESAIRSVLSAPTQDPTTGPPASVFLYLADTNLCPILSTTTTTDSTSSPQPFPVTVLSQLTASYVSIQELLSRCGNGPSARITTRLTNGDIIIQSLLLGSNAPKKPLPNPATETFLRPPGFLSALSSVSHTPRQASATASLMDISPGPGTDTDTDNDNTNEPPRRQQRVQSQQDRGLPPSLVYTVYACYSSAAAAVVAASSTPESPDSPPPKSLYVLASEEATKLEWIGKRWQEEWRGEPGVA